MSADLRLLAKTAFSPDAVTRVGVAVSGGSDSLASLLLLAEHVAVEVVTVDHGLRAEAADEARFVAQLCAARGWPHEVLRWRGRGSGNLMDQARRARAQMIGAWARGRGLSHLALGHTADDEAETFLMRLGRQAGLSGLAGMRPRWQAEGVTWARPFLRATRADLRAYLSAQNQPWIDDPSNQNPAYTRVRARKALADLAPLGVGAQSLSAVCDHLAEAEAALTQILAGFVAEHIFDTSGDLTLQAAAFRALPRALQRRLMSAMLLWIAPRDYPPRQAKIARLLDAVAADALPDCTLAGAHLSLKSGVLRLTREYAAVAALISETPLWDRWTFPPLPPQTQIRATGPAGLAQLKHWRDHLPRASALASPSLWQGDTLLSAPLLGHPNGYIATLERSSLAQSLFSR